MDAANTKAMSEWVQFWRLFDLKLLRSIALKPGPRGGGKLTFDERFRDAGGTRPGGE